MSMKMTRESFDQLIAENIGWLVKNSPDCLERNHIVSVLGCASESHYGRQSEIDRLTRELAEAKARESARKAIAKVYGGTKMSSDYTQSPSGSSASWVALPTVPQAFFDEFGMGADDKVMSYGHACAEHVRAPLVEENARLVTRIAESDGALVEANKLLGELCTEVEKLRADAGRLSEFVLSHHSYESNSYAIRCLDCDADVRNEPHKEDCVVLIAARKGEGSEG